MANIQFKIEQVLSVKLEMEILLIDHYEELTLNKSIVKLNPDWEEYNKLEQANKFILITVRLDSALIGYIAFFIKPHIHYKDLVVASNDVLYLKKEYRLGMTGVRMLKYAEQTVKELGANKITWHVKHSSDFRPILHRMGYFDEDIIVGKIL
jgi:GNAT superfamily N-acetyltransferase